MIKWNSFDVAEFKYTHIVFVIDRQTQSEMSRETYTHRLLTIGEKTQFYYQNVLRGYLQPKL